MEARHTSVWRRLVCFICALVTVLGLTARAWGATTTQETGPLTPHEPQTYVWNLGPNKDGKYGELTNKATGEHISFGIDNNKCPILLPGDTFEVIPEPTVPNGRMNKGISIANNDHYPDARHWESRGSIEVTKTETHGDNNYIFVTEFKIVGDYPVCFWSNGGGDCASTRVSDDVVYNYTQSTADFIAFVPSVGIRYEYWSNSDDGGRFFTEDELATAAYYSNEENPTIVYAEDALVNKYAEDNETLGLTVRRPYIEGYFFGSTDKGWPRSSSVYDYRGPDWNDYIEGRAYNWWEGWYDNKATIYPQWGPMGATEHQAVNGSDDEYLLIRYKYDRGRTLTLDACGGTIDGYPTRIYEATGRVFEGRLADGTMDQELASGTAWTPVREGYIFAGWYEDAAYTKPMTSFEETLAKFNGGSDDINKRACHLYARWTQNMYRLYNPNSGEHFYTASEKEKDNVVAVGWQYEGIGWVAPETSSIPVYRLYNQNGGEHHYTINVAERDMLVEAGWNDEGIGWYSDPDKTVALLREYNPNQFACNHNYTTSRTEHDYLVSLGWHDEGVGWYGVAEGTKA
ncbi:MAG: hypothetical protein Q4C09_06160 [Atopobiaceae bacterium]|nr:hypothetical protein [Atopobiaceae bacterium]